MGMMDDMRTAQAVKDAWAKVKVTSSSKHSFSGLVMIWKMLNKICLNAKERMESEIADINETYAPNVAAEKKEAVRRDYRELVTTNQKKLSDRLEEICKEKTAEVDKIISTTGNPELMELVKGLSLRKEVSDREWQAIIIRVTESHDFQAMKLLSEIASKLDRYYKPPYDPDEIISEIEKAKDDLSHMISVLDRPSKDWTFGEMMIMGEYDHRTYNQERLERLDSEAGVAVPEKQKSLIERLKDARDVAFRNGDNPTANAISRFIYEKSQYIDDRQVVEEYFKGEAEALIRKAINNASANHSEEFDSLVKYLAPSDTGAKG